MRRFTMRRLGKRLLRSQLGGQASGRSRRKKAKEKQSNQFFIIPQIPKPEKPKPDILEKAIERGITSHGNLECAKCGSDTWAVVPQTFLFVPLKIIYCEKCKTPLSYKDKYGYISYKDFQEVVLK